MRKLVVVAALFVFAAVAAQAQLDVAFGVNTVSGPSASSASGNYAPQNIGGGAYPTFSGDYIFWHNMGIGGMVSWRASQALWGGQLPYRPIFYSFNGVFAPRLGKHAGVELQAGLGGENIRFYTGNTTCSYFTGCSNYQSTNHFMGHFGGGLRLYVKGNFFIRPEGYIYLVRNNFEFSGARATQYGVSIGYTWGEMK
jgi:hypothetical protein